MQCGNVYCYFNITIIHNDNKKYLYKEAIEKQMDCMKVVENFE
jgi:hypothetical protein